MDDALRRAWTEIITDDDYEQHMAAIGQAQAAAELTSELLECTGLESGAQVVIAGAGTGQLLEFLDPQVFRPYRLTFTDLNAAYLSRLAERLAQHGLTETLLVDDFENSRISPGCDLLLATLLLEHIDWRKGTTSIRKLRPGSCAIIMQENPPGVESAVTPGRSVPASLERAMKSAIPTLIPRDQLVQALSECGYSCSKQCDREVADGKHLIGLLFQRQAKCTQSGIT